MSFKVRGYVWKERLKKRVKEWKEAVREFFTRRRYLGNHPRTKRAVTVLFLLVVVGHVWTVFYFLAAPEWEGMTRHSFTNQAHAWSDGPDPEVSSESHEERPDTEGNHASDTGSPVVDLIRETFPEEPEIAVAIASAESGLDPEKPSETDLMRDGRAFSYGLMQINLTVHKIGSSDCPSAFRGSDYEAVVVDEALYRACVALASDPKRNLDTARGIYDGKGGVFHDWGAYLNGGYKRFL